MTNHLWLIGMMGSGKSTIGRLVAAACDAGFVDTDDEVAARAGCAVAEIWRTEGEAAFREMEAAAVERLAGTGEPHVIATGGGVVLRSESVTAMRSSGTVVWLAAGPGVLASRIGEGFDRPLVTGAPTEARLAEILRVRKAAYEAAADAVIATAGREVDEVAREAEAAWRRT
jgi:shikimate kinase